MVGGHQLLSPSSCLDCRVAQSCREQLNKGFTSSQHPCYYFVIFSFFKLTARFLYKSVLVDLHHFFTNADIYHMCPPVETYFRRLVVKVAYSILSKIVFFLFFRFSFLVLVVGSVHIGNRWRTNRK